MDPFGTENKQNKRSLNMSKYFKKKSLDPPVTRSIEFRTSSEMQWAMAQAVRSKKLKTEGLEELQLHSGA